MNASRALLRGIDWCDVQLRERDENLGLGRSILRGMGEVFSRYEAAVVFEDDLVCVPGTYAYLCAALRRYREDPRVMSVTGWTHARVKPPAVGDQPYFDGRAECWTWGSWSRAWHGMERDAKNLVKDCQACGLDVFAYGADLPAMAEIELTRNIWAVRFLYHHLLNGGLCLRPPWSMVEHIGVDAGATNAAGTTPWTNAPLRPCPPIPQPWPEPALQLDCPGLWQRAFPRAGPRSPLWRRCARRFRGLAGRLARRKTS